MKNLHLIETRRELRKNTKKCQVATRSQKDQSLYGEGTVPVWQRLTNHQLISNLSLTIDRTFTRYAAMILCVLMLGVGQVWGQTLIEADDMETSSGTGTSMTVSGWNRNGSCDQISQSTDSRTGTYSMKTEANNTSEKNVKTTNASMSLAKNDYLHCIGWAKLESSDNSSTPDNNIVARSNSYIGGNGNGDTVKLNKTTWRRFTSAKKASSNVSNAYVLLNRKHGSKLAILFDDVVIYKSTNSTTDVTAPSAASSASATASSISWTNGSDSNTGIANTLIWRRTSGSSDNLTLNAQGVYAASATDQSGHWTCVNATVGAAATSYSGTFSAGDRYAIVHRDLAYNYSTPTYVTVEGAGATTYDVNIADMTNGSVSASPLAAEEDETVTLTVTPSTGYELASLTVTGDESEDDITVTNNEFSMPAEDVTVSATFSLIDYTVSKTLTNCAVKAGSSAFPSTLNYGDDFSTIIEPTSGNLLPGSITVSGVSSYTWNALTGALALTDVTGNVSVSITAAAPQTGTSKTITYTMITSGSTVATYSSSIFSNVLSGSVSAANTVVASSTMKGGNGVDVKSGKTTPSNSYTAGITSSTSDFAAGSTPYVEFRFDVVDGYTFTPTGISVPVQPISNAAYFKILVTDESSTWTTTSSECTQGTLTTITTAPTGGSALTETVYVRVYCYSQATSATGYRFKTPITITGTVAEEASSDCSAYEFHYGTHNGSDWETACFERVGETNEWKIENFTIPSTPDFYVGYHGDGPGGWNDGWSAEKAWTDAFSDGNGAMVLLPTSSSKVGLATGATGTLIIWSDSGDKNKYVGFKPDGYAIMYGGNNYPFASTATANMWETNVVTLPNCTTTYQMGINTASSYTTCAHSAAAEALNVMGVTEIQNGKRKIYLDPGSNLWRQESEKIAIFDFTTVNSSPRNCWGANDNTFMTYNSTLGLYEGYVLSDATDIIFVRCNPDLAAPAWGDGNVYNQTDNCTTGTLANKFTITGWSNGSDGHSGVSSTTGEAMHPTTGEKGKFRMWDNSGDDNWYVHFIPYNVLTYDANGGTGTTAQTERNTESSTTTVTVASNGFTAPTGYEFAGWATSQSHADAGTVDYAAGADYTLTSNATLYAVWSEILHDVTVAYKCGETTIKESATVEDAGIATSQSVTAPDITGYTFSTWSSMPSGVTTASSLTSATISINATADSKTITANYTANEYSITYKDEGDEDYSGSNEASLPDTHTYGTATDLVDGVKAGYTFEGWFTDDDCTVSAGSSLGATAYTDDITLYAKWEVAASLTAISADVLYQAASMANITFTGSDQYWAGLSTNNLFQTYGDGTSTSAKGKTITSTDVTDDIGTKSFTSHAFIEGSDVTSGTDDPTYGAIEFITPSSTGILYVYTIDGSSSNLKLRKKGSSTFTALTGSSNYNAIAVDANSNYYIHGNASKRGLYGIQYVSTYAVTITPTNVTKATGETTAIKGKAYTATFTANTGYALPDDATVSIGGVEQTKGTGYTWTISDGTATLTVPAAKVTGAISIAVSGVELETYAVTYNGNGSTSGDAPTDATAYVEGDDVTVLGKNTLVKTNNGFAGWNTVSNGSGTWRVQGETFSMGAADVELHAQWVPTANLTVGTLYTAGDMKAKAIGSSTGYRPGYSSNGIFELLGVGTDDDNTLKNSPMQYNTDKQTIDGTAFTHALHFKGTEYSTPSGTTLPTARAIKFHVGESGTLHLWVRTGSKINIVKDGGSASAVGSSTERTHETVEVTAGTWYLYATGTSTSLYGMKLMTCTDPELAYGTTAVAKNYGDDAFTNTLTKAAGASPTFSSDNPSVATVDDSTGEVTIVGDGSATITASISDDATYCDDEASYTLTVYPSYTVTYNAMGGTCGTESAVTELGEVTLPSATHGTYTTYTWVTYDGAFVGYEGEEYEPSGDITLYAKWQGDCAAGGGSDGVLFSAEFKDSGLGTENVCTAANDPVTFTTDQLKAEPTGGSISAYTTNTLTHVKYVDNGVYLKGTDGVIKITLEAAINTNDLFEYVNVHSSNPNAYLRHTSASNTTDQIVLTGYNSKNVKVMLPAAFNGKKELYIVKQSTDFKLHKAAVVRPAFLMLLRDDTPTATTNLSGTDEALTTENYLEVIRGGSVSYTSPSSGNLQIIQNSSKNYIKFNSTAGYVKIVLNDALQEGDVIGFDASNTDNLALTVTAEHSTSITTTNQLYTVGSSSPLKDKTTFYLWQNSGSGNNLRGLQIARSAVVGSSCYAVIYDGNGADGGYTNDPKAYDNENNDVTVLANGFTRTGYVFKGWNTEDDGDGDWYYLGDEITDIDADVTLYAIWAEVKTFTDATEDHKWSTAGNWSGATSGVPSSDGDYVVITKPAIVDVEHAMAWQVVLDQNGNTGKLTIQANKGLEVAGTITRTTNGSSYGPTREQDLVLESSSDGNASLIFENAGNAATVQQYSKASIVGNTWNWQYVGTPFTGSIPQYNYYGSWMYKWNNGGWSVVKGSDELTPFVGYCLTQESATTHVMGGTLVSTTDDVEVTMAASTDMVLANSWTAPIWIGGFTEETFTSAPATIYLFNTGSATKESGGSHEYDENEDDSEAGTYVTVPVNSAPYTGNEFIASMQGFFVTTNGGTAGTITMKYDDLVRPSGVHTGIVVGPMKAPKRAQAADDKPAVLKMWANGSEYNDRVVILERADFSEGFDNGWDGKKMSFGVASPSVYVINAQGGYDAVSAIPDLEGTVVGFRAGADNNCTMTFSYEGDDTWYLNDLQAQKSTLISEQNSYAFTTSANDSEVRFIISATPIQKVATGIENDANDANDGMVRKVLINDHIYIIRSGRIYSVDGVLVK